jgi:hypothetical protein
MLNVFLCLILVIVITTWLPFSLSQVLAKMNATIIEGGATFDASVTSVSVLAHIMGNKDPVHTFEQSPADFILLLKNMAPVGWATLTTDMRIIGWREDTTDAGDADGAPKGLHAPPVHHAQDASNGSVQQQNDMQA